MVLVFDAMRPDYIDRFHLKNFQRLRKQSTEYINGYVGHMASETVVAHAVIPTGLAPKNLPWQDDVFLDKQGILGKEDAFYVTGDLSIEQYHKLLDSKVDHSQYLEYKIAKKFGGKTFAVGAKTYAAAIFGGPTADGIVTFEKKDGKCRPIGINVPRYIQENNRFEINCKDQWGTGKSTYPLDGNRHIPGNDPAHQGGDVWVGDVAEQLMQKENWSALFLTFSGIDKISHMLGEHEGPRPHDFESPVSFESILLAADHELGRILDNLEKQKLLDKTLIIVTADHGGQGNQYYFGTGDGKAYAGEVANPHGGMGVAPGIQHLISTTKVRLSFQDSAVRVWIDDKSPENRKAVLAALGTLSGVTEVFEKNAATLQYKRILNLLGKQPAAFQKWANAHSEELLNTMACEISPDYFALLADDVGYGILGEHGGAQEKVQRIPYFVRTPGGKPVRSLQPKRLMDIAPIVIKEMGL